jgi:uncharacterized protein (TIGR02145 family)
MKTTGTSLWNSPNQGATNSSGFSGVPGGNRYLDEVYNYIGDGYWWSATEYDTFYVWIRFLYYLNDDANRDYYYKPYGISVRCLRD